MDIITIASCMHTIVAYIVIAGSRKNFGGQPYYVDTYVGDKRCSVKCFTQITAKSFISDFPNTRIVNYYQGRQKSHLGGSSPFAPLNRSMYIVIMLLIMRRKVFMVLTTDFVS